jgi:hypothetical protein
MKKDFFIMISPDVSGNQFKTEAKFFPKNFPEKTSVWRKKKFIFFDESITSWELSKEKIILETKIKSFELIKYVFSF